ncbi:TonB protein C-terminal [Lutibacter oricola]|uniref:TonB protein C-terminal n=1 Tax=Lutibacter oricola TaxID=762486 RepID=A0A1H3B9R4_9FLAO|nr:M56 family metallopeptidase [Lutibacter oricola]SDX38677.1 TonB protein C-terminal [Lutibacter oricola]
MINYIIQVVLFQAIFLAVYDFFLQKETFFKWNRVYLIVAPIASFIIPWLKFDIFQKTSVQEQIVRLPEVIINPESILFNSTATASTNYYLNELFLVGVILFSILFFVKLFKIISIINKNTIIKKGLYKIVILKTKQSAFSFFNFIFINKRLLENKELEIIEHEMVHCKQRHTLDLLFFEVLKIAMWFNPMVYIFQKRITVLHEYISDAEVVKKSNKKAYFNKLLAETFDVENISFTNQFYKHSLIKKRIAMIAKNKSQKVNQLKYLMLIPALVGMLVYSSCANDSSVSFEEVEKALAEPIPNEGKYLDSGNVIMFIGSHLNGEIIPLEDYTTSEKELLEKFQSKNVKNIPFSVVIDDKGDRVLFLKVPTPPISKKDDGSVPFATIDNVPVFPGCENSKDKKQCIQEAITKHVNNEFNSKLADDLDLEAGTKRIFVMFTINKNGEVSDVKARAPHKILQEEAIRVIKTIPNMIPGKHKGNNVSVKYSLPIAFVVEGDDASKDLNKEFEQALYILNGKETTKSVVDKINPDSIERIDVLKGNKAIEKYGEKGKNGVVEIVLKK